MIHNAWHFQFKFGFCVYGGMAKFRVSVAHTLMRRYVLPSNSLNNHQLEYYVYTMYSTLFVCGSISFITEHFYMRYCNEYGKQRY